MSQIASDRCVPSFSPLLDGFGVQELERSRDAVYGLDAELRLAYMNPAWFRFAVENGGPTLPDEWVLGCGVLEACGPLREFYEEHFGMVLGEGTPWGHEYECSGPDEYRRFHMHVYPLGARAGLLVVHTLEVDHPQDPADHAPHAARRALYEDEDGFITQCAHCRRVKRSDEEGHWDWVPKWVDHPPSNTTGSLCRPCYRAHYPEAPRHV